MRNARDELADGGELLGPSQVIRNFALLGEIPDADDEPDDYVARIPNVAEGNGSGELGPILSTVDVLAGPERLIGGYDDRDCLPPREVGRGNHEIVNGQTHYL